MTSDMATILQEPFEEAKVLESFYQIHPTKALSPNHMPTLFFCKFWHVIHNDVLHTTFSILNDKMDPSLSTELI